MSTDLVVAKFAAFVYAAFVVLDIRSVYRMIHLNRHRTHTRVAGVLRRK